MAEINVDYRNIVNFQKCAFSSPEIGNLEIRDESPGGTSKFAFNGIPLNQISYNSKFGSNKICGCDNESDNSFVNYACSSLSTFKCDERPSNKITLSDDISLLDLLNSGKLEDASKFNVEDFKPKKNITKDKMKIISSLEVDDGVSGLLSSITHDIPEKDEVDTKSGCCQRKDNEIDILNFDFTKNECTGRPFLSNNLSLKAESNLSELLSSLNIESTDVTKVGSCNASKNCNSTLANKSKVENEPILTDLSDLLSSIDLGNGIDNKVDSRNKCNKSQIKVEETKDESCLADLLASIDIDKHNTAAVVKETGIADFSELLSSLELANSSEKKVGCFNESKMCNSKNVKLKKESCLTDLPAADIHKANQAPIEKKSFKTDLSDLLSSIDLDCNNTKLGICNQGDMCSKTVRKTKNESHVASLLPSVNINKLNKPSSLETSKLLFKDTNDLSNLLDDFSFDAVSCSSSSTSCASSYGEKENSSRDSDKVSDSDSGYKSSNSSPKEFSFFNYTSDNQLSFNTLLTKSSDISIPKKHFDCKDARNTSEEMSMSDLLTIVSPEFKNPVMAAIKKETLNGDRSNRQDSIKSLNTKLNSPVINKISVNEDGKLMGYDVVDRQTSKKVQNGKETNDFLLNGSLEETDVSFENILNDDEILSNEEQTTFIDLRECIVSSKHHLTPSSPNKQVKTIGNQKFESFSPKKVLFFREEKLPSTLSRNITNPFDLYDAVPRKKIKLNTNQTLFSKALACKPKKDQFLQQKVTNIKRELLNAIKCRPVYIDCDVPQPIVESVLHSDKCILSNDGLVSFGRNASQY